MAFKSKLHSEEIKRLVPTNCALAQCSCLWHFCADTAFRKQCRFLYHAGRKFLIVFLVSRCSEQSCFFKTDSSNFVSHFGQFYKLFSCMSDVDCSSACWSFSGSVVIATDVVCVVEGLKHLFFNQMLVVSAVLFGAIKVILFGGLCAHDETWRLEYVSTQLAHCSNVNSSWSWMFVYAFETQILLLLKAWERLFQNVHVLAGSIVACACNFLIAMACVVEFQFDGSAQTKIGHRG